MAQLDGIAGFVGTAAATGQELRGSQSEKPADPKTVEANITDAKSRGLQKLKNLNDLLAAAKKDQEIAIELRVAAVQLRTAQVEAKAERSIEREIPNTDGTARVEIIIKEDKSLSEGSQLRLDSLNAKIRELNAALESAKPQAQEAREKLAAYSKLQENPAAEFTRGQFAKSDLPDDEAYLVGLVTGLEQAYAGYMEQTDTTSGNTQATLNQQAALQAQLAELAKLAATGGANATSNKAPSEQFIVVNLPEEVIDLQPLTVERAEKPQEPVLSVELVAALKANLKQVFEAYALASRLSPKLDAKPSDLDANDIAQLLEQIGPLLVAVTASLGKDYEAVKDAIRKAAAKKEAMALLAVSEIESNESGNIEQAIKSALAKVLREAKETREENEESRRIDNVLSQIGSIDRIADNIVKNVEIADEDKRSSAYRAAIEKTLSSYPAIAFSRDTITNRLMTAISSHLKALEQPKNTARGKIVAALSEHASNYIGSGDFTTIAEEIFRKMKSGVKLDSERTWDQRLKGQLVNDILSVFLKDKIVDGEGREIDNCQLESLKASIAAKVIEAIKDDPYILNRAAESDKKVQEQRKAALETKTNEPPEKNRGAKNAVGTDAAKAAEKAAASRAAGNMYAQGNSPTPWNQGSGAGPHSPATRR